MVYLRLCFTLLVLACMACSEQEAVLDNFEQHLCSLTTDANGRATALLLDNGTYLRISNKVQTHVPNDTLRVLAYLVRQADGSVRLGATRMATTLSVPTAAKLPPQDTPTMQVVTLWRSSHFINLRINVRTHGEVPTFALTRDTIQATPHGTQTATLHLYRMPSKALAAYTHTHYLSIDLRPLAHILVAGQDSIALSVHTDSTTTPTHMRYVMVY